MAETAYFGAGCFWGAEETFRKVKGVVSTAVGYMGGDLKNPTYEHVCTDKTGHAEVVQVVFDPAVVSYDALLGIFWEIHDPTTIDRQGPDIGEQYRSVIFHTSDAQRETALKSRARAQERFPQKIATAIEPAKEFWRAEEYHQKYIMKTGRSCH